MHVWRVMRLIHILVSPSAPYTSAPRSSKAADYPITTPALDVSEQFPREIHSKANIRIPHVLDELPQPV
jgi:hypothetical protein